MPRKTKSIPPDDYWHGRSIHERRARRQPSGAPSANSERRHHRCSPSGPPATDRQPIHIEARLATLPKINVPTIVIHGAVDDVNPHQNAEGHQRYFTGHYERRLFDKTHRRRHRRRSRMRSWRFARDDATQRADAPAISVFMFTATDGSDAPRQQVQSVPRPCGPTLACARVLRGNARRRTLSLVLIMRI